MLQIESQILLIAVFGFFDPVVLFSKDKIKGAKSAFFIHYKLTRGRDYQPVFSANALPMSARERTVLTPAASNAANLSSAVPLPPEMIAPA